MNLIEVQACSRFKVIKAGDKNYITLLIFIDQNWKSEIQIFVGFRLLISSSKKHICLNDKPLVLTKTV